ncbi:class I SAM-dependent methyltransferase [Listeria booriae]|uniref:class I SAM-dependent methyltransferase n=1 Tax=Listeria booriae TaxID=1552123 RepID=UPI001C8B263A|nr:class I SAM-dependent methyltransferase [Listeria booriae]
MQLVDKKEIDFSNISVDTYWNFGDSKEDKIHKIHSYPAKFPSFITQKALEYAERDGMEIKKVADLFCGCGTAAYEANKEGYEFWGCDINPVAALIARVKSRKLEANKLNTYYDRIMDNFNVVSAPITLNVNDRIKYWYEENQIIDLMRLRDSITTTCKNNSYYLEFFLCAFSNILKPTSRWLTKAIKPQIDPHKKIINVKLAYQKQFRFMYRANEESGVNSDVDVRIEVANSLELRGEGNIDLIVTSPPYVTSYEYADLHQLSLLWLNFTDDYRVYRANTIGSKHSNIQKDLNNLNRIGSKIVEPFLVNDKSKARAIKKYYLDMQAITKVTHGLLANNGMALFVIGNTEYKGVHIDNAQHLALSLYESGFKKVYVTKRKISNKILSPYRDENGKFSSDTTGRKIYNEEFILIGRK